MSQEIPDYYQSLMKDWIRIDLPPHANPHDVAAKCHVPPGSYFATPSSMWLETQAYVDAVKPLMAAEAIASPASQPEEQLSEQPEQAASEEPAEPSEPEEREPGEEPAHIEDGD